MNDVPRSKRGEPMRCPSCDSRLVELERTDILIDACPECRGVWLDRGELDSILERERRVASGVRDDDEDFLREMSGKKSDRDHDDRPRHDDRDRRPDDRHYGDRDKAYYKKKKRKSMMEELFDF